MNYFTRHTTIVFFGMLVCAKLACAQQQNAVDVLLSLEEADHSSSIEFELVSEFSTDTIVDALVSRLEDNGINAPSSKGKEKLWLILSRQPADAGGEQITKLGRITQMEQAILYGSTDVKANIINNAGRLLPYNAASQGVYEQINIIATTASDPTLVITCLYTLSQTRAATEISHSYIDGIVASINNANEDLKAELVLNSFSVNRVGSRERELWLAAHCASISNKENLEDAVAYVQGLTTNNSVVLDAMSTVGHEMNVLEGANLQSRRLWLEEYERRINDPNSIDHTQRHTIRYLYRLAHEYSDLTAAIVEIFARLKDSHTEDSLPGHGQLDQFIEHLSQ